eukprot:CAMPEP_0184694990 /NCGR_PEP_ID=MMETSP0313-20130426/2758_1 /TAXON_ID=2792 /ORGANISM="Porphyridium aerugineum, Strain SAG 1380-2" /LENGTH=553 /DNA_ID=CAMNT_0027153363 /DNA_START=69 /DNA_END=1730 /DNA_ORIENTATION=-
MVRRRISQGRSHTIAVPRHGQVPSLELIRDEIDELLKDHEPDGDDNSSSATASVLSPSSRSSSSQGEEYVDTFSLRHFQDADINAKWKEYGYRGSRFLLNSLRDREVYGHWVYPTRKTQERINQLVEHKCLEHLDMGRYHDYLGSASAMHDGGDSTISIDFSHDGRFFASTHGNHTTRVFAYPSCRLVATLQEHPRTAWIVKFHPSDSNILACASWRLECTIWSISAKAPLFHLSLDQTVNASISGISFHPLGDMIAIASGRQVLLWDYKNAYALRMEDCDGLESTTEMESGNHPSSLAVCRLYCDSPEGGLYCIYESESHIHIIDFHPSGDYVMIGERNETSFHTSQLTIQLSIHEFSRCKIPLGLPVLVVPEIITYNGSGAHFSPNGQMLVACVPPGILAKHHSIAVFSLAKDNMGDCLFSSPLDYTHSSALTNLRFSSASSHILAAFYLNTEHSIPWHMTRIPDSWLSSTADRARLSSTLIARAEAMQSQEILKVYCLCKGITEIEVICPDKRRREFQDRINTAVFCPGLSSMGFVYGTQNGRIRIFEKA